MTYSSGKYDQASGYSQKKVVRNLQEKAIEREPSKAVPVANARSILALQRSVGNQAVTRWIQAKLMVGPVGDSFEQEADRVAEQVVSSPAREPASRQKRDVQREGVEEEEIQTSRIASTITPLQRAPLEEEEVQTQRLQRQEEEEELQMKPLQRQEDEEEVQAKPIQRGAEEEEEIQTKRLQRQGDEEELQMKPLQRQEDEEEVQTKLIQRAAEEEEEVQTKRLQRLEDEEELQGKFSGNRTAVEAGSGIQDRLSSRKGQGNPFPGDLRAYMEPRFGASFSNVRLHTDSHAIQLNRDLKARAFTHGSDIYLGQGQYNPGSIEGKRLLAHELTHVIQQTGAGKVQRQSLIQLSPLTDAIDQNKVSLQHQDTYRSNDEMDQGHGQPDTPFSREWYVASGNKYHSSKEHLLVHAHYRSINNQVIETAHLKTVKNRFTHDHIQLGGETYSNLVTKCNSAIDKDVDLNGSPRNKKVDIKLREKFRRIYGKR
jgi:hypothetical protein